MNTNGYWVDISHEEKRVYYYSNSFQLVVTRPKTLIITRTAAGEKHDITLESGEGMQILPGWLAVSWVPKRDETTPKFVPDVPPISLRDEARQMEM